MDYFVLCLVTITMSRISAVDDVSSINTEKNRWRIVVKVVRAWLGQGFAGSRVPFTMDMVLMDSHVWPLFTVFLC